jgi:hypothetical protein
MKMEATNFSETLVSTYLPHKKITEELFSFTLKMEAEKFSETLISTYLPHYNR